MSQRDSDGNYRCFTYQNVIVIIYFRAVFLASTSGFDACFEIFYWWKKTVERAWFRQVHVGHDLKFTNRINHKQRLGSLLAIRGISRSKRYWTSKQCQFSCFMNLSWRGVSQNKARLGRDLLFCGLIESFCFLCWPICSIIFFLHISETFFSRQHTRNRKKSLVELVAQFRDFFFGFIDTSSLAPEPDFISLLHKIADVIST